MFILVMERQAEAMMPTEWGNFRMLAYADNETQPMPHIAMVHESFDPSHPVLVRIHSECMTGDLFSSKRCDCGEQLDFALTKIAEQGGILIYLRQEGRGIGLINKLKAYTLQDTGLNTADANTHLGLEVDARQYDIAIQILEDLAVKEIRLLTNNPLKIDAVKSSSIQLIGREAIEIEAKQENRAYLKTKKDLMGHLFSNGL